MSGPGASQVSNREIPERLAPGHAQAAGDDDLVPACLYVTHQALTTAPGKLHPEWNRHPSNARLYVVVELELVRVRAEPEFVELGGPLVVQPGLDEVLGEHAAFGEEGVVALQGVEDHVE
jgi:hypothetical protein